MSQYRDGYYWSAERRTVYRALYGRWFSSDETSVFPDYDDLKDSEHERYWRERCESSVPNGLLIGPLPEGNVGAQEEGE